MSTERLDKINAARRLLDYLETHPEVPLPDLQFRDWAWTKEEAQAKVKLLGRPLRKVTESGYITFRREFGTGVCLSVCVYRSTVCEKVDTGERKFVQGEPAREATPDRYEPVYDYKCGPVLGLENVDIEAEASLDGASDEQG